MFNSLTTHFALIVYRFRTPPCHGGETSSTLVEGVKFVLGTGLNSLSRVQSTRMRLVL